MKPRVALVTIGHVDHGKSTLLGRLLVEKGVVPREEVARYERQAALLGKASFTYAWVLDRSEESRARGLTLDLNYADFLTRNRKVHLIDARGARRQPCGHAGLTRERAASPHQPL